MKLNVGDKFVVPDGREFVIISSENGMFKIRGDRIVHGPLSDTDIIRIMHEDTYVSIKKQEFNKQLKDIVNGNEDM